MVKKKKPPTSSRIQEYFNNQLNEYFPKKSFKTGNGRIKIGGVSVNKKDLLHDLTHQVSKPSSFNLTPEEHTNVLIELKKLVCLQVLFIILSYETILLACLLVCLFVCLFICINRARPSCVASEFWPW